MEFIKDYAILILCVAFLTEGVKMRISPEKVHPKWTSLMVAIVLSFLFTFLPNFDGNYLHLIFAFGMSIILYDYFLKIGIDYIKGKFNGKKGLK